MNDAPALAVGTYTGCKPCHAVIGWEKRLAHANEHVSAAPRWAIAGRAVGGDADRLRAELSRHGDGADTARWYATTDFDELQEAVTSGDVSAVLFTDVDTMMEGVFDDRLRLHEWAARSVRIELLDKPLGNSGPLVGDGAIDSRTLLAIEAAWRAWYAARRRRRAIAGAVLSVLAILAATAAVLIPLAMR